MKVTAKHFCKTCEDPEPLCEICAKQHTRQRALKAHELSGNIHDFPQHRYKRYFVYLSYSHFSKKLKAKAAFIPGDSNVNF